MKYRKLSPCCIYLQVILSFLYLCMMSCTGDNKISGTEISNEDAVCLVGKVLDMKGLGVSGIVAGIDKLNLSDTTDITGSYSLILTKKELIELNVNLDTMNSSVKITNSGNIVSTIKITKWIDSLPSVLLVQRNISGKLSTSNTDFRRIVAVISKLDADRNILEQFSKDLWLNTETMGYSGFCYILNSVSDQNYSVYVNVYNSDSVLTGKSKTVFFSQLAGDIEIPSFDPYLNQGFEISAGNDTTLTIKDSLHLSASLPSGSSTVITKWEWNINGNGFVQTSGADTVIIMPDDSIHFTCKVKATDTSGYVVIDSINIGCIRDIPSGCNISYPIMGVARNDTVTIFVRVYDLGKITKCEWNAGDIKFEQKDTVLNTEESALDSSSVPGTDFCSIITFITPDYYNVNRCSVKLTDDDGNTVSDTAYVFTGFWKFEKNLENRINNPLTFSQNDYFYVWSYMGDLLSGTTNIYKSDFENSYSIGSVPLAETIQRNCISQDGSIYAAGVYNQNIELYRYRDSSVWELIPSEISVSGNITSLTMESSGDDIFIGAVVNGNRHALYKYNGNNFDTIDVGINNCSDQMLITKAGQNRIIIFGKYTDDNESTRYYLKKYSDGILSDISSGIDIKGTVVSILCYKDNLLFGVEEDASYLMHSGIFNSYLCKYSDNAVERFGGYIGLGSQTRLNCIFQRNGDLYVLTNGTDINKLE